MNKHFKELIVENFNKVARKIISFEYEISPLDSSDLIDDVFTDEKHAEEYIVEYGVILAVELISNFEQNEFGGVQTDFKDVVNVANSLYFALATELINSTMKDVLGKTYVESREDLKQVQIAMNSLL